jgi:hypothetical protein
MGRAGSVLQRDLAVEAARLICEERVTDYRYAKQKAAERLGLGPRNPMPDNREVEAAVLEHQRLFGGEAYRTQLRAMRESALRAMKLLAEFHPRICGGAVSGAIGGGHRVQLHAFSDAPEQIDLFLQDHGIEIRPGERRYRYADGREAQIPLACFEAGEIGIDVALFDPDEEHRPPLSPIDGRPVRRLNRDQLQRLIEQGEG